MSSRRASSQHAYRRVSCRQNAPQASGRHRAQLPRTPTRLRRPRRVRRHGRATPRGRTAGAGQRVLGVGREQSAVIRNRFGPTPSKSARHGLVELGGISGIGRCGIPRLGSGFGLRLSLPFRLPFGGEEFAYCAANRRDKKIAAIVKLRWFAVIATVRPPAMAKFRAETTPTACGFEFSVRGERLPTTDRNRFPPCGGGCGRCR